MNSIIYILWGVVLTYSLLIISLAKESININRNIKDPVQISSCNVKGIWKIIYQHNSTTIKPLSDRKFIIQAGVILEFSPCENGIYKFTLKSISKNKGLPFISIKKNSHIEYIGFLDKEKINLRLKTGDILSLSFLNHYYDKDGFRAIEISQPIK